MNISRIHAREILDSKATPTLEVEVELENGSRARAGVPSGASTGATEAHELRDHDDNRFSGKGVLEAVQNINGPLAEAVSSVDAYDQLKLDETLIAADGTENKSKFGGNAILGVSLAVCKAAAQSQQLELYQYLGKLTDNQQFTLPQPMILILEGGKHGNWSTDIQEFMIVPQNEAFSSFKEQLRAGAEIFHTMEKILKQANYSTGVGFEGAFAPQEISSNEEAFELLDQATSAAGYTLGKEIVLAIDAASSEFFENGEYILRSEDNTHYSAQQWGQQLKSWSQYYHVWSIEDPFHEESWTDWAQLLQQLPSDVQLVGDDLLTTNVKRINKAVEKQAVNSVLIKPNQIGTVSETLQAIKASKKAGYTTVISHRSGETNDDFIADLAVGTNAGQCKFGGPDRGERLAKYNRLLRIEEQLEVES